MFRTLTPQAACRQRGFTYAFFLGGQTLPSVTSCACSNNAPQISQLLGASVLLDGAAGGGICGITNFEVSFHSAPQALARRRSLFDADGLRRCSSTPTSSSELAPSPTLSQALPFSPQPRMRAPLRPAYPNAPASPTPSSTTLPTALARAPRERPSPTTLVLALVPVLKPTTASTSTLASPSPAEQPGGETSSERVRSLWVCVLPAMTPALSVVTTFMARLMLSR